ncbi:hypothetical protein DPMN_035108 [Dreissena polymorpha]|uniref:Uncharacterized protein n=1 Tax=Dreissena polymorpha TaxID=45954 RepID=A0A9D4M8L9_DREPO|nr:hypothetical protein DPMN_035108 [Dreissena polymorpha]
MKSWEWPMDYKNIVEVFMMSGWDTTNINLSDLSLCLNVWKRCLRFPRTIIGAADALRDIQSYTRDDTK